MRRVSRAERARRVEWAAELLDITAVLDRRPRQLSGGQRQRVAMGRALVREPTVFLLDEPLSNLDAKLRVQVRAEIGELQRRTGTTMIYVTHDQVEAMTLGDRVAVLNSGRLQQVATPRELYDRPANVFVAGFIGNPAMNLFPARLAAEDGETTLLAAGIRIPIAATGAIPADTTVGDVTAGIRPEALSIVPAAAADGVPAIVEHVEWLGHETLAHARTGDGQSEGVRLVARLQGMHEITAGDSIRLQIDANGIHLFGADGTKI
jgi:ABC-type sugar transport system ATPase subunit